MDHVPAHTEREEAEHKENEQPVKSAIVLAERSDVLLPDEKVKPVVTNQTEPAPAAFKVCFVLPIT